MSTIEQIQYHQLELESTIQTFPVELAKLNPGSPEYLALLQAYLSANSELAQIPTMIAAATEAANADAIHKAGLSVIEAIETMVSSLEVAKLLGKDVVTIVYVAGRPESIAGANDAVKPTIRFNPTTVIKASAKTVKKADGAGAAATEAKGRKSMHGPNNETLSQKAFVERFGNAEDNDVAAKWAAYKHVRISAILGRDPALKAAWTLS
jgi:hypothetical protein